MCEPVWLGDCDVEKVFVNTIDFALRERQDVQELDASRQCLGSAGQALESSGAGQHVPAWAVSTVQFGLDRLQHFGHSLVLIDTDRAVTLDKVGGRGRDQFGLRPVVKINDADVVASGDFAEHGRFTDRSCPLKRQYRCLGHALAARSSGKGA